MYSSGDREKNMRVDWSKPESKKIHVVVRSRWDFKVFFLIFIVVD